MKFKYRQPMPEAMKRALKEEANIKTQTPTYLNRINEKICPNCRATYNARKSKGICIKCFCLIPKRY